MDTYSRPYRYQYIIHTFMYMDAQVMYMDAYIHTSTRMCKLCIWMRIYITIRPYGYYTLAAIPCIIRMCTNESHHVMWRELWRVTTRDVPWLVNCCATICKQMVVGKVVGKGSTALQCVAVCCRALQCVVERVESVVWLIRTCDTTHSYVCHDCHDSSSRLL